MRQGHHNVFLIDQVFDVDVRRVRRDFGTTRIVVLIADRFQLFTNDFHQTIRVGQDVHQLCDLHQQLFVLIKQFFMLEAGQFLQAQIQNSLCLLLGKEVFTFMNTELWLQPFRACRVITGTGQHCRNVAQIP